MLKKSILAATMVFLLYLCGCTRTGTPKISQPSASDSTHSAFIPESQDAQSEAIVSDTSNRCVEISGSFFHNRAQVKDAPYMVPVSVAQSGSSLILLWNLLDGVAGPAPVEVIDAKTGTVIYQEIMDGYAYNLRITDDNELRIIFEDRLEFRRVDAPDDRKTFLFPTDLSEPMQVWSIWCGDPFDADLNADLLAYPTKEGIMISKLDGSQGECRLNNEWLPDIMDGVELPEHKPSQLVYVNPMLLEGGKYLAATIYMLGDESGELGGYDSCPYGVSVINLETGEVVHTPDNFLWLALPAKWLDDSHFGYLGYNGYNIIAPQTGSVEVVEFELHEEMSYDFKVLATVVQEGESWNLYTYPAARTEEKKLLLELSTEFYILEVTPDYILCKTIEHEAEDQDARLLIVPYANK